MKRLFVVAFISFFDNELTQEEITAVSPLAAGKKWLIKKFGKADSEWITTPTDLEELNQACFNCDSTINVFEIGT